MVRWLAQVGKTRQSGHGGIEYRYSRRMADVGEKAVALSWKERGTETSPRVPQNGKGG